MKKKVERRGHLGKRRWQRPAEKKICWKTKKIMLPKRSSSGLLTLLVQGKHKINFPKIVFFSSINLQTVVEMATRPSLVTRSSASLVSCVWLVQTKGKEPGAREVRRISFPIVIFMEAI